MTNVDSSYPKVIVVIPARGGSLGIKNKNIKPLNGKPLIAHTIESALKIKMDCRVIVTTDDAEIKRISEAYGAEVPFLRPSSLSGPQVGDHPVFLHLLQWLEKNEQQMPDIVIHYRCTTPLKDPQDAFEVLSKFKDHNLESVRSVTKVEGVQHPYWMLKKGVNGKICAAIDGISIQEYYQRQLLPKFYRLNGVIDAIRVNTILTSENFYGRNMELFEIPDWRSIDIDTELDFELAEFLIKKYGTN